MEGIIPAATVLGAAVLLGALIWKLRSVARSMVDQSARGLMVRMLARQGLAPPASARTVDGTEAAAQAAAHAFRNCAMCQAAEECERFLASGDREGFEAFCPNSGYILQRLRDAPGKEAPAGA